MIWVGFQDGCVFVKGLKDSCHALLLLLLASPGADILIQVVCVLRVDNYQKLIFSLQRKTEAVSPCILSVCVQTYADLLNSSPSDIPKITQPSEPVPAW